MPEKKQKIVLLELKKGETVRDFASAHTKKVKMVDSFSVMQGEEIPDPGELQYNEYGGFYFHAMTDTEARQLAKSSRVVDIIDDEMVYAFDNPPGNPGNGDEFIESDPELLQQDAAYQEMLEREMEPEFDPEEPQLSNEQLRMLSELSQALPPEFEREEELLEGIDSEVGAAGFWDVFKKAWEIIRKYPDCIAKCIADKEGTKAPSRDDIEAMIKAAGGDQASIQWLFYDVILWNIKLIRAHWAWRYSRGGGVRVAVVDTGIDYRHYDLRVYGGVSYVPGVSSFMDDHGHGTHVAGTVAALANRRGIVGVAPAARLYAVKVLNRNGSGYASWILNGLTWCIRHRMHVVNLSLGSNASTHDPRVYNMAYERAGQHLRRYGILAVAAAGNNYHRPVGNPARCPSFMAVSAVDYLCRLASFSSIGPQVEIAAPGVNILSTIPGNRYGRKSGTSMAAPHVAGAAALVKYRRPYWHGDTIRVHLWRTARDLGSSGRDWAHGYGLVDAYRAVL